MCDTNEKDAGGVSSKVVRKSGSGQKSWMCRTFTGVAAKISQMGGSGLTGYIDGTK
jgi:hypothetical protein